ncbi:hypothetical protein [Bacillus sp. FJAT-45037]|uniref:hypothetical protein n=1 Tax=Bacillus sp. FJAT-45037 TaxID=2011007 RepID=UPI0012FD183B|nr:hypothetical protein [Bacillus sp. FJAT-45037]
MTKNEFDRLMSLFVDIQKMSSQEMLPNVIEGPNRDRYAIIPSYFFGILRSHL